MRPISICARLFAAILLVIPLALAAPRAQADPLRAEIADFARTVDEFVSTGQFAYMDTMLAPNCVGQSTLAPPMNCKDMYFVELAALFGACGSECAGGVILKHQLVEVAPMSGGDAWAWLTSTVTSPSGTCLTKFAAHNRFTRVRGGAWQMTRIMLLRVPCDD